MEIFDTKVSVKFCPMVLLYTDTIRCSNISARMVARYAPPISYNFLNLISLDGKKTTFEEVKLYFITSFICAEAY